MSKITHMKGFNTDKITRCGQYRYTFRLERGRWKNDIASMTDDAEYVTCPGCNKRIVEELELYL